MTDYKLPKDISNICLSYFDNDEKIYYEKKWDKFNKYSIFTTAVINGWFDLLIWARQNNYDYDFNTYACAYAALNNHLEILKWLVQNGCPWDEKVVIWASYGGHLEILKWALQNGCKWHENICYCALDKKHVDIIDWIKTQKCLCACKYHKSMIKY